MQYDICGLGSLAMDVLIKVDRLPLEDGFCIIEGTERQPGGSGTNVIVQAARLGASCDYIAALGDDSIGKDILENLKAEHVNISDMQIMKGCSSLYTDILIDRSGKKVIMLNMSDSFMKLTPDMVNYDAITSSKVFYTDFLPSAPALAGLKTAKAVGVNTVFNMQAGMQTMSGLGITKQDVLDSLQYTDVFAPCHEGMIDLTGTEDPEKCRDYLRKYCSGILIFTQGSKGSMAFDENNRRIQVPAEKITPVDTTGAGDSYIGGFMFSYFLRHDSLEEAMKFATVCAAHTCGKLGARASGTLAEVSNEQ